MTALAGFWSFGSGAEAAINCRSMLEAQKRFAREAPRTLSLGNGALGCALYPTLPEDSVDAQPYVDPSGDWALVADVRIDNREDLLIRLRLPRDADISDAELFFRIYARWGSEAFQQIIGDYAIAIWDAREQSITLARDYAGSRPLHYHVGKGFVAFSTMAEGLHSLPQIEKALNPRSLALFLSDSRPEGPSTFFRHVARVAPGEVVRIDQSGLKSRLYWQMPQGEVRFKKDEDYVEAFREQLERATRASLRGSRGFVAAQLSAGLDSSAVAATAASLDAGSAVLAITSAPRLGFRGRVPRGRIGDESELAAQTAALYPNVEHMVLRSDAMSPIVAIEEDAAYYGRPLGQPCNYTWGAAINHAAQSRGAGIVLTGSSGNLTISAGGPSVLADMVRFGRWGNWWREARAGMSLNQWRLRGVLACSVGPWVPSGIMSSLRDISAGDGRLASSKSLISPEWQANLAGASELRPASIDGSRRTRWKMLQQRESGNYRKGTLARWGVDERDPTGDRRLAEFCLSLPPEQLLKGGVNRYLARSALADRLPADVINAPRGYQFADWYENVDRAGLLRLVDRASAGAGDVLDLPRLRALAESWPLDGRWDSLAVIYAYRLTLLRGLAAGAFAAEVS